ncbi:PRC-barrel domain-containing protein [Elioraea sp.]|uniref:PRC-barrel domain-containing protein n=1 Tax=Elioraea sp. TaxID=2185103 RepID=UPI0025C1E525|nr:PRC-barrel domain-containing protein [Elioraea sp.]
MSMIAAAGLFAAPMLASGQSSTSPMTPAQQNPPGTAATRAIDGTVGTNLSGTNMPGGTTVQPVGVRRASTVIGATVYNERNESIGTIDDMLIGETPMPLTAVVSVGGFLGIGAKLVSVPLNDLRWDASRERFVMAGATKEGLQALPEFRFADRG